MQRIIDLAVTLLQNIFLFQIFVMLINTSSVYSKVWSSLGFFALILNHVEQSLIFGKKSTFSGNIALLKRLGIEPR